MLKTKREPLVSVVIPFYNRVDWLEEAVDSVLEQTYTNYEIIVVNDGSKEEIEVFLKKYSEKIRYIYQENAGSGSARNNGVEHAKGEYIALLDSDDIWCKDKLELQIQYMEDNPGIMWSHSSYETFGCEKREFIDTSKFVGMIFPNCMSSCRIATPCVVIRRSVLQGDIKFSENMRYGQDFYLWVVLSEKYEIGHMEQSLCKVRMRGNNAAKRAYVMLKAKSELWSNLAKIKGFPLGRVAWSVRSAYRLCEAGYKVVNGMAKVIRNTEIIEFLSKVAYIVPYMVFKIKRK